MHEHVDAQTVSEQYLLWENFPLAEHDIIHVWHGISVWSGWVSFLGFFAPKLHVGGDN